MLRVLLSGLGISVLLSSVFLASCQTISTTSIIDLNGCSDKRSDCPQYKNQCTPSYPFVLKNCKKTCNLCPSPSPTRASTPTPTNATEASGNKTTSWPTGDRSTTQTANNQTPSTSTPPSANTNVRSTGTLCTAGPFVWLSVVLWILR